MTHTLPLPLLLARKASSLASRTSVAAQRQLGRFAGRRLMDPARGNDWIASRIAGGKPLMVTRIGSAELGAWNAWKGVQAQQRSRWSRYASIVRGEPGHWPGAVVATIANNAGFFPATAEALARYAAGLEQWIACADATAIFTFTREEERLLAGTHAALMLPMALEPYVHDSPWTLALEGRKVLVVHPFAASIAAQYPKRGQLFAGKRLLPAFELRTVAAVQSIGGHVPQFPDWFAALDNMKQQIAATDFDIAIIGAGAYGMALAAHVKGLGKQAIHLGGSTQVLFGIKGKRWDSRPEVACFYNEHWVRPSAQETPPDAANIEGGCYW